MSTPNEIHQTEDYKELTAAIISFAKSKGIQVTQYESKELYRRFGSPVKRTRKALMKRLVILYPELEMYYNRELTNKNKYYVKMFEAIAAGASFWLEQNS